MWGTGPLIRILHSVLHQLRRWLRLGIGPDGVGDVGLHVTHQMATPNDRDVLVTESNNVSFAFPRSDVVTV